MTEINEAVVALLIEDIDHDPETCCFCARSTPESRTNDTIATPDEDDHTHLDPVTWVKFDNNSGTLGGNLTKMEFPQKVYWVVRTSKTTYQTSTLDAANVQAVKVAAHHLIPGNAALAKSKLMDDPKYLAEEGTAEGNIGYDINKGENGIWAPGNYAMRPWGTGGRQFVGHAFGYASAAIETAGVQFHDAHPVYSIHVLKALNRLADKVDHNEQICPYLEDQDPSNRVLVRLVARLDFISWRCRRMVTLPSDNWKLQMYLSRYSKDYMTNNHLGG